MMNISKVSKLIYPLILSLVVSSCVSAPGNLIIRTDDMAARLKYQGFQMSKPSSPDWFIYSRETHAYMVTFRRDFMTETYDSYVTATLAGIPSEPKDIEEFEKIVQGEAVRIVDTSRFEVISIKTKQGTKQNQWCIYYSAQILDKRPINSKEPLIMQNDGFFVLHPSQSETTVHGFYSQRGLKEELNQEPDPEVQFLLDSIQLYDKQGKLVE